MGRSLAKNARSVAACARLRVIREVSLLTGRLGRERYTFSRCVGSLF
jgi:hypothetical protein